MLGLLWGSNRLTGWSDAGGPRAALYLRVVYETLFLINLIWNLLNLLPIWPLDGGQVTSVALTMAHRRDGARWAHIISLLTAGVLAVACWIYLHDLFQTVFFAFFALVNFQMLQALHYQARFSSDDDWWKR